MTEPRGTLASRWFRVGETRIHARVSDEPASPVPGAPPLVLVHGFVISSRYMVPTAERLAPFFRVYAPDLPGFGRSGRPPHPLDIPALADALAAWMDAAGLERAAFAGNSMGCQVIVDLAARAPGRVESAVLSGPSVDPHARTLPRQLGRLLQDAVRERPSLLFLFLRDLFRMSLPRAWRTAGYVLTDRMKEELPLVQAPTLVVRGSRDPVVPQPWAEEMVRLLPRGRLAVLEGAPHGVNYSTPAAFSRLVHEFVTDPLGTKPLRPL